MSSASIQGVKHALGEVGELFTGNRASAKAARKAYERTLYMSNTEMQRRVLDLKAAGLNPMLAYSLGGASAPNIAASEVRAPGGEIVRAYTGLMGASTAKQAVQLQREALGSQIALNTSNAKKADAEADLARATIPEKGAHKGLLDAQSKEILAKLEPTIAEIWSRVQLNRDNSAWIADKRQETVAATRSIVAGIGLTNLTIEQREGLYEAIKSKLEAEAGIKGSEAVWSANQKRINESWYGRNIRPILVDIRDVLGLGAAAAVIAK